jgi:K+-transporting ATPase ATPase C chain
MAQHLRPAIILLTIFTLITGVLYPLVVTGIAQAVFPRQANGSLIEKNGRIVGSELIGQQFTSSKYFWGRVSATDPVAYNSAASTGSNYGPMNKSLLDAAKGRVDQLKAADSMNGQPVPVDLATSSGSGLDPHISVAAAAYQVSRVARTRNLLEADVRDLVARFAESRDLGFFGEPRVNVLKLNLALDNMGSSLKGAN